MCSPGKDYANHVYYMSYPKKPNDFAWHDTLDTPLSHHNTHVRNKNRANYM